MAAGIPSYKLHKITIKDYKEAGVVEAHCQKMKRNGIDILNANGLHFVEMTPYENEKREVSL